MSTYYPMIIFLSFILFISLLYRFFFFFLNDPPPPKIPPLPPHPPLPISIPAAWTALLLTGTSLQQTTFTQVCAQLRARHRLFQRGLVCPADTMGNDLRVVIKVLAGKEIGRAHV